MAVENVVENKPADRHATINIQCFLDTPKIVIKHSRFCQIKEIPPMKCHHFKNVNQTAPV